MGVFYHYFNNFVIYWMPIKKKRITLTQAGADYLSFWIGFYAQPLCFYG